MSLTVVGWNLDFFSFFFFFFPFSSTRPLENLSSRFDGEELFVQGGELDVGRSGLEAAQGLQVEEADVAERRLLGQEAVDRRHVALDRQRVRLGQLYPQRAEDGEIHAPYQVEILQTWTV
jgi:hypothetical protein